MTAPASTRRAGPFDGNGVTTSFPFSYKVFATSDIRVIKTSTTGNETTLALGSDYSVTLNVDQDSSPGGSITYPISGTPLADGEKLTALGNLPYDQTADLPTGGNYRAVVVENALDRTVFQVQQLAEEISRSLTLPASADEVDAQLPAPEANKALAWNNAGTGLVNIPTSPAAPGVAEDVTYTPNDSPPEGTVAAALDLTVYAELYAEASDTSQAPAFQRAIDAVNALGGGVVMTKLRTISFHQAVVAKPRVKVHGLGIEASVITTTAHTFHAFTDNNVAAPGFEVHGFTIQGPSAPTGGTHTNRGIFLDAQGASYSTRNRFSELRFRRLFRGLNVHQADDLAYDMIEGEDLLDSVVYVGEVVANRSLRIKHGRVYAKNCLTYAGGSGGGASVIAYADDVECAAGTYTTCGPSSGAVNLHHALYLRSVRRSEVALQTCSGQKRGAALHVFSDVGEPRCADVSAVVVSDAAANYVGVRVAGCDGFTLRAGSRISDSALQGVYLSDCARPTIEEGVLLANNNVSAVTSAVGSAAIRADGCSDLVADGATAIDDTSTAGQYGQGTFLALEGVCPRPRVNNCKHIFPGSAVGYYFVALEAGSAVTHPAIISNHQDGPQNFLLEAGTPVPAGQGIVRGHTRVSAATAPLLSVEQLHRWRVRDCWNEGARFGYESDGVNVFFWATAHPVGSTWAVGDRWERTTPAAAGTTGGRCVVAGTPGTWKFESNLSA